MKNIVITAIVAAIVSLAVSFYHPGTEPAAPSSPAAKLTAYERVLKTGVLRCAYASYEPMLIIDPNTRQFSGIFYDLLNEISSRLNLKVEWVEEVGYGNINAGFVTGRYDAFCAGLWPSGNRARNTVFSLPLFYDPISVWVRGDDARFDGNVSALNDPAYKIAVTDGDATVTMANAMFPQAGRINMTQNNSIADEINQVTTGKADAMFRDYLLAASYLASNPGKLKDISPEAPLLNYPLTIGFNDHELELKKMIDTVISEISSDGTVARIVKKHLGDKSNMLFQTKTTYESFQ
ncbi:MAG: transporter substrate-binding domain-containing protein [Alphaproteobacteria bacterium]